MDPLHLVDRVGLVLGQNVTLGNLLERLGRVHGDRQLVEEAGGGPSVTFAEAADLVDRWAGALATATRPGDVVVVGGPNGYHQLLLCLAASRAGCLPAPVNPLMAEAEVAHVVDDADAHLVLESPDDLPDAEPLGEARPADPGDVAALFYTSGTTGQPKGVELSHRSLVGSLTAGAAWPGYLRRDEAVVSLPIAHIMGFVGALGLACAGIPVYFLPHFNPVDVLDAIESRRATLYLGVPAMYRMLLEAGADERDLHSVRVWMSGADAMPSELAARFKKMGATVSLPVVGALGEAAFAEGYGMVESGGAVAGKFSAPFLSTGLGESVGMALPGYRFRVVGDDGDDVRLGAVGELLVKGPGVTSGYRGAPDATADALTDDGWLRTGDLARRGPLGMVVFAGRKKDVVKHGGYSVHAVEVEHALEEHPAVAEAAVVGLADERKGEVPVAAVRLVPPATLDRLDLQAWAAERLADYKVPVRFLAVDELPRTGTRKVQRAAVAELFA